MVSPLLSHLALELRRFSRAVLPIVTPLTVALGDRSEGRVSSAIQAGPADASKAAARDQLVLGDHSHEAFGAREEDHSELRVNSDMQWERVTKVLNASIVGAEKAAWAQLSARDQLDAGDYELASLVDDLAGLVPGLADVVAVHASEALDGEREPAQGVGVDDGDERALQSVGAGGHGASERDAAVQSGRNDVAA